LENSEHNTTTVFNSEEIDQQ